jgi:hypothetical protein
VVQFEIHRVAIGIGLWETMVMAKHLFGLEVLDGNNRHTGFQCTKCGKIVPIQDGKPPQEYLSEECTKEDASQAAVRIVRQATENQ